MGFIQELIDLYSKTVDDIVDGINTLVAVRGGCYDHFKLTYLRLNLYRFNELMKKAYETQAKQKEIAEKIRNIPYINSDNMELYLDNLAKDVESL